MPTPSTKTRCHALRITNPFTGTVQVVEQAESRAFSSDGINWEIQVLADDVNSFWGMPNEEAAEKRFYRYAVWSATEGLVHLRVNPIQDIGELSEKGDRLLHELEQRQQQIPFPLADRYELWLLDETDKLPLALVETACGEPPPSTGLRIWHATRLQQRDFPTHAALGDNPQLKVSYHLEQQVRRRNGSCREAQWFLRRDTGLALGLHGRIHKELIGRELSDQAFPQLLLQERWADPTEQQLADDYLLWLAPKLLTLQHLTRETRAMLERAAGRQPALMEALHHLYPEVIDPELLTATRVRARLTRATAATATDE